MSVAGLCGYLYLVGLERGSGRAHALLSEASDKIARETYQIGLS